MGILSIQKGVNYLLRAWNKLGLANAELVLVGQFDRYDRSVISNLINNTKNVRLVPGTDEPESFFKSADLFVLPSIQDGFGMVVLEAMACGVPVVVSQNVGAKDCVRHSTHDFIISPSNVDDLVEAMQFFYKNRDYKFRFVNELVSQAQKFSWDKYKYRFIKFIRQD
jgi:glycosyltransferase involved in cell wall biosynthesis